MALTRITKGVIKPNENYDTHNINSTGIITATGANISGNMSVGGVLTYEDVTNIDSVGIITARAGVRVNADGSTSSNYMSVGASDDLKIYHDSNSVITNTTGLFTLNNASSDGSVYLQYSGSNRLYTDVSGVSITGNVDATGLLSGGDGIRLPLIGGVGITTIEKGQASFTGIVTAGNFVKSDGSSLGGVQSDSNYNTLGGTGAGNQLTNSTLRNTFFGWDSGTAMQVGEKNTFIGAIAGKFQNNSEYNTGIGDAALCQNSGNFNTGLGYNAAAGESERLTMEHTVAIGYNALRKIDEADFNVAMGSRALENCVTGNSNIAIGYKSLFNANTSSDNVAIGSSTGINLSTAANENTFIGYNAGQGVTTGDRNTAIGMNAMASTDYSSGGKTGSDNIAIGRNTMSRNTGSGSNNVFIGSGNNAYRCSNGSNNIGIGQYTFYYLTTGNSNIALGNQALDYCDTGHSNIALGQSALTELTGGSGTNNDNIAIGSGVATNLQNGANNIIIGKNASTSAATVSNEITLGNNNINHLRVPGIGVTFATNGNHITGITTFSSHVQIPDAVAGNDYASLYLGDGNDVRFFHNGQHTFLQHKLGTPNNGGQFLIDSYSTLKLRSSDGSSGVENAIIMNGNGSVELYHSGTKRFETTSTGVDVIGPISDNKGDLRSVPQTTTSSNLVITTSHAGKHILHSGTGGWTINTSTGFAIGNMVTFINNTASAQTLFQASGVTLYDTADGNTGDHSIKARGMATAICTASNVYYISGTIA